MAVKGLVHARTMDERESASKTDKQNTSKRDEMISRVAAVRANAVLPLQLGNCLAHGLQRVRDTRETIHVLCHQENSRSMHHAHDYSSSVDICADFVTQLDHVLNKALQPAFVFAVDFLELALEIAAFYKSGTTTNIALFTQELHNFMMNKESGLEAVKHSTADLYDNWLRTNGLEEAKAHINSKLPNIDILLTAAREHLSHLRLKFRKLKGEAAVNAEEIALSLEQLAAIDAAVKKAQAGTTTFMLTLKLAPQGEKPAAHDPKDDPESDAKLKAMGFRF